MTNAEKIKKAYGSRKRTVKKAIKACQLLIDYYNGEDNECAIYCSLCTEFHCHKIDLGDCGGTVYACPWRVFTGFACAEYAFLEKGMSGNIRDWREERDEQWVRIRKPMLKRWIKYLKQYYETI